MTKLGFLSKMGNFFGLEDDETLEEQVLAQPPRSSTQKVAPVSVSKQNVVPQNAKEAVKAGRTPVANPNGVPSSTQQTRAHAHNQPTMGRKSPRTEKKVVPIQSERKTFRGQEKTGDSSSTIMVLEPRIYSEAMSIAKHVMGGKSVLVNFHLMEEQQARRIVDFLTGTVYAEDGDIKRVSDEMFLCTPKTVEIEGAAKSLVQSEMFDLNEMSL